jgi:outer membrane cobalamin receptor
MKSLRAAGAAALAAALALVGEPAWAQAGTASLTVVVKDNYGVVPGASVRLIQADNQESRRAVSDKAGAAQFAGLGAAEYTARASMTGFADTELAVTLAAGETKSVEMVLSLVQFSTTVTVTTANRRDQLLLEVAEPTTLIDEVQILDTGSRTAKDLLVQQAGNGIQVNAGGGQGYVSLNGIPNSGVLVLVDGRRFLGRDANGNFNMEEMQMAGMERVEVVKGPGSALYGADALGGVINFITKKAKDPGWRNSLGLLAGSYEDYRVNDSLGFEHAKGGFSAYGSWRTYDGFDLEPNPERPNPQTIGQPGSEFVAAGFSGDFHVSSKVIARLFVDYNDRHIDPYYFSGATQLATTVYNSVRDLKRYMISPELEITPASNLTFNLQYN